MFQQRPPLYTVIDVLCVSLKSKDGSETADVITEIIRERKMFEKFINGYEKGVLQRRFTENLEKTQC